MPYCANCKAAIETSEKFCTKCGSALSGAHAVEESPSVPADVSVLLKDIEFGPVNRKTDAIGKLCALPGVRLSDVQSVMRNTLRTAADGSLLKLFAAYNLAVHGDSSDLVADALHPFMSAGAFETRDSLIEFPWATNTEGFALHPEVRSFVRIARQTSPQFATIEAFAYMRTSARAAQGLHWWLEHSQKADWRLMVIYAAGANGHSSLRPTLEYLAGREPGSVEAQAGGLALEHFGTLTLFEIAERHARLAPREKEGKKSGCFIATAVYGTPEVAGIKVLQGLRDQVLMPNRLGRLFVAGYYKISPSIARIVSRSVPLRTALRRVVIEPAVWTGRKILRRRRRSNSKS
jgi:hypothetical protein